MQNIRLLIENIKRKYKPVFIWVLIFIFFFLMDTGDETLAEKVVYLGIFEITILFIYYAFYKIVFPKYWYHKRLQAIIWILFLLIIYLLLNHGLGYIIMPLIWGDEIEFFLSKEYIFGLLLYFSVTCIFAISNYFSANNIKVIEEHNKREQDLLRKELNFFKQQLNPEIIFDFLDYCYQNTKNKTNKASEAIVFFSNLLHYTFEKRPGEEVELMDEINYINDFINLQKLLSSKVYVKFNKPENTRNITILPRVLITFIENAFKHGQYTNPLHPILINMDVKSNQLLFIVNNKIGLHKKKTSTGTGLENVKQILELFYKNNYELKTGEQNGTYHCELKLYL